MIFSLGESTVMPFRMTLDVLRHGVATGEPVADLWGRLNDALSLLWKTPPHVRSPFSQERRWTLSRVGHSPHDLLRVIEELEGCFVVPAAHFLFPNALEISTKGTILSLDRIPPGECDRFSDKASRLARIRQLGFPVPAGVVVSSEVVSQILRDEGHVERVVNELLSQFQQEDIFGGAAFGDSDKPGFVSVRSGAERVMEGLLPTLLNIGLNDDTVKALAALYKDSIGAYRLYLKFVIDYGIVVCGLPSSVFDEIHKDLGMLDVFLDTDILEALKEAIVRAKGIIHTLLGQPFPEEPREQLKRAIWAIAKGWEEPRVREYRDRYGLDGNQLPAALFVQRQVFGSLNDNSAALVAYSRDPRTGERRTCGLVKVKATGDEVMTGSEKPPTSLRRLSFLMPEAVDEIDRIVQEAEKIFREPVKVEITIQDGKVNVLQVASLPMWAFATLRSAVEMATEGTLDPETAVARVPDRILQMISMPRYERPKETGAFLATGKTETPGTVEGVLWRSWRALIDRPVNDPPAILVTDTIIPPEHWEAVFRRVRAIVLLCKPGAHFFPRAHQAGVAVFSRVDHVAERFNTLPHGTVIYVDASREDAFATDQKPLLKPSPVARFMRGEETLDQITSRRGRDQARWIQQFRQLKEEVKAKRKKVDVLADCLHRTGWATGFLKEATLGKGWLVEAGPPPELRMRHDGSTDPSATDFNYTLVGDDFAIFIRRLWAEDDQSPKRLAVALLNTEELEHAFALTVFRHLPPDARGDFLNDFVRAARADKRNPGRPAAIYLISRFLSVVSEDRVMAQKIINNLAPDTVCFLVEDLYQFFQACSLEWKGQWAKLLTIREAQGVALKNPLLAKEELAFGFFRDCLNEDLRDQVLREPQLDPEVRKWFGTKMGCLSQVEETLRGEAEKARFNPADFLERAKRVPTDQLLDYVVGQNPPLPLLEPLFLLLQARSLSHQEWSAEREEEVHQLTSEGVRFVRDFFERSLVEVIRIMVETRYGEHSQAMTFFRALSMQQKTRLMNGIVDHCQKHDVKAGWTVGIFLLSRFVSLLVPEGAEEWETIQALSNEALVFISLDFFILSMVNGIYFHSSESNQAYRPFFEARHAGQKPTLRAYQEAEDAGYIQRTYDRYPHLNHHDWIPFLKTALGEGRWRELLVHSGMHPGVRSWFEHFSSH